MKEKFRNSAHRKFFPQNYGPLYKKNVPSDVVQYEKIVKAYLYNENESSKE